MVLFLKYHKQHKKIYQVVEQKLKVVFSYLIKINLFIKA